MKSLEELEQIKKKAQLDMSARNQSGKRIIVGMATCGIAAGARPVMAALVEELHTRNIMDVSVTMTGCLGLCRLEPIVEVIDTDGNKVTYVKMDANKAKRVIAEHVINGQVCQDLTITSEDTK
jgi:NADP-reducing hydrogenase subunit HndB